jgi:hypothetical protein
VTWNSLSRRYDRFIATEPAKEKALGREDTSALDGTRKSQCLVSDSSIIGQRCKQSAINCCSKDRGSEGLLGPKTKLNL